MKYTSLNKFFFFLVTEKCGWETFPSKKWLAYPPTTVTVGSKCSWNITGNNNSDQKRY